MSCNARNISGSALTAHQAGVPLAGYARSSWSAIVAQRCRYPAIASHCGCRFGQLRQALVNSGHMLADVCPHRRKIAQRAEFGQMLAKHWLLSGHVFAASVKLWPARPKVGRAAVPRACLWATFGQLLSNVWATSELARIARGVLAEARGKQFFGCLLG